MCSPTDLAVLSLHTPFGAPVYHKERVDSTMDEARALACAKAAGGPAGAAGNPAPHGTVIAADYQSRGRGRNGRPWFMEAEKNLSFTVILRYPNSAAVPSCLTLKAGLALSYAVGDFAPSLRDLARIKWPNDLMLIQKDGAGRKAAGILAEASGGT
ncbi:MAG: hypothetical protein LBD09_03580, partial [Treponema sp.]|nr:hypothetical protein [Treponema sp.]